MSRSDAPAPPRTAVFVGGLVLLSNTLMDVPLDWVEHWWPVAPIALGVYLVVKAIQEKQS